MIDIKIKLFADAIHRCGVWVGEVFEKKNSEKFFFPVFH